MSEPRDPRDPHDPLADQLRAWADAAAPVTPAEVRRRAEGRRGGSRRPGNRTLLVAAAAVLALVAGVVGVTVLRDDDTSPIETIDGPSTTTLPASTLDPETTEVPSSTTTPPATTTEPASGGPGGEPPAQWVGVDGDHRMVVVDTATGDVVRVLTTFDDPDDFGDDGEEPVAGGNFAGPIDISPDGQTVFYETCCEPAVGLVFRIPITGGEPEQVTMGTNPAVSPDGTKLAVVELQGLKVVDLVSGEETTYTGMADAPIGQEPTSLVALRNPAWSPDGTAIALERYVDDLDQGELVVVELDGGEDVLLAASALAVTDARGTPMHPFWFDARTVDYVRQGMGDGFTPVGPATSEVADRYLGEPSEGSALSGPVVDTDVDPSGTRVITTFGDGRVVTTRFETVMAGEGGKEVVVGGELTFTAATW